ncbi:hypothetical protein FRB96_008800 [Tulasnella sp. 330]|nr:hypothetical protein FRB96_008800 [Tulasnella sp. 330]
MHRSLLQWRGLLSALKAYRCYRQEAVMNAIIEATARDTDLEYAPLVHRMKLIVTGDKDEPGLTQDILSIALRHRLPKKSQKIPGQTSDEDIDVARHDEEDEGSTCGAWPWQAE